MPSKTDGSGAGLAGRAGELARGLARAPYVPASAYRLQLNRRFTFVRATELLGYFADIGTEEEFAAFCDGLKERGLGQILDIVPNHMGIAGNANAWWLDVLENGASSAFAHVFDIDWDPVKPELKNSVLLARGLPRASPAAANGLARGHGGDLHPRLQAQRGRAHAAQRAQRDSPVPGEGGVLRDAQLALGADPQARGPGRAGYLSRQRAVGLQPGRSGQSPAGMVGSLFDSWQDGRIKMHLLRSGLRLRRRGTRRVLAAGGRFFTETLPGRTAATDKAAWQNTVVVLPDDPACAGPWRDVFTGETVAAVQDGTRRVLEVPRLFGVLSAALLVNDPG